MNRFNGKTIIFAIIAAFILAIITILAIILLYRGFGSGVLKKEPGVTIESKTNKLPKNMCPQELTRGPDGSLLAFTEGHVQSMSEEDIAWVTLNCVIKVSYPK